MEFFVLYAFVPAYEFGQSAVAPKGLRVETDFKAWYDLVRRFNHMFQLGIDLSELEEQARDLKASLDDKIAELQEELPQLNIEAYMEQLDTEFTEMQFAPLDAVWDQELRNLFEDTDN